MSFTGRLTGRIVLIVCCLWAAWPAAASACDLCAIYRGTEAQVSQPGFGLGVFEQYTHFGTLQYEGREVPNVSGQYLDSSVTQFIFGYQFNERVGVQVNVPYIFRAFKRPEGFSSECGTESGLGDLSLTGSLRLYEKLTEDTIFVWGVFGGVKFPTGDSGRIKEELNETEPPPGAPESGIHGHDLALGSGSYDGVFGTSAMFHWKRLFATASFQYAARSAGDFGYRYADDMNWSVKPGGYLYVTDESTLGLQMGISGESKGKDAFRGEKAADTGITSLYLGPELSYTWTEHISANVGADFPVVNRNTSLQMVPDYKLHAAFLWRF